MPGFQSDRRLYLNADRSKVVEEGDPDSAYLLVHEGGEVSDEDAKQYGLKAPRKAAKSDDDDESAKGEPAKAEADKAEQKQLEEPPQNKARAMRSAKD